MKLHLTGQAQRQLRRALAVMLSPVSGAAESEWHRSVLNAVMPITGAYKSAIRVGYGTGFRMTPIGFEESAIQEHRDYYHQFDFGRALGGQQIRARVFSRNAYYSDFSRFQRTEYYADYLAKYRVFDALCISSRKQQHDKAVVLYLWHERENSRSWRDSSLGSLRLLANAFRAGAAAAERSFIGGEIGAAFDASHDGCAVFTSAGTLLHRNPALTGLMAALGSDAEVLWTTIVRAATGIGALLFSQRPCDVNTQTTFDVRVRNRIYHVSGCALPSHHAPCGPAILVAVNQSDSFPAGAVALLEARFGLTKRECEVAFLLACRLRNHEIAERMGVSIHTARHHTENIMLKMQVVDRREVARIVSITYSRRSFTMS